jgi:hypothetical protein
MRATSEASDAAFGSKRIGLCGALFTLFGVLVSGPLALLLMNSTHEHSGRAHFLEARRGAPERNACGETHLTPAVSWQSRWQKASGRARYSRIPVDRVHHSLERVEPSGDLLEERFRVWHVREARVARPQLE